MVAVLARRADSILNENYNGHTVESIQADVQGLLEELAATNSSLQSITLNGSHVTVLQDTLQEVYPLIKMECSIYCKPNHFCKSYRVVTGRPR